MVGRVAVLPMMQVWLADAAELWPVSMHRNGNRCGGCSEVGAGDVPGSGPGVGSVNSEMDVVVG